MASFDASAAKLKFGDYLIEPKLPELPKGGFGHVYANVSGGLAQFYGNQKYGDCVLAGAAHEECHWAKSTGKLEPAFTEANIISQYLKLAGGKDVGLDPVAVARHRVSHGISDAQGKVYKIKAFALIDNLDQLAYGCYLFDLVGIGAYMPDSAEQLFAKHMPWTDISQPPNKNRGHYFPALGRNRNGIWVNSTWADYQGASDDWIKKYCFDAGGGALVYFSKNYLTESGKSREGFNEAQLDQDLKAITRQPMA